MDSEPSFKSMMKSARTNGTGIPNESFQKRNIAIDENRWIIGHDRDDDTIRQNGFDDVISNDSNPQQSNSAAEAKETKEQGTKEQGGKEEGGKKPKMPEKTTPEKKSASDPVLEAIHQMRYGQTFVKTGNPQVNDARARMANGKDEEAFEDAASDDEQYWVSRGMNEQTQGTPGFGEGEDDDKKVGTSVPQPASGSDPGCNTN